MIAQAYYPEVKIDLEEMRRAGGTLARGPEMGKIAPYPLKEKQGLEWKSDQFCQGGKEHHAQKSYDPECQHFFSSFLLFSLQIIAPCSQRQ